MKSKSALFAILIVAFFAGHIIYLTSLTPKEEFSEDTFLQNESNRSAIIIVAHDEDTIAFSGTVAMLVEKGWEISCLCFYGSSKIGNNAARKEELKNAALIAGIRNLEIADVDIVNRADMIDQPWMPVPPERFHDYFKLDTMRYLITNAIFKYKPSVIFTLDDTIGGNGNPQHLAVSKCIDDVCTLFKDTVDFPVKKIYQSVVPRSLEEKFLADIPSYQAAKKMYHVDGMPAPDVAVSIADYSSKKKDFLSAFTTQKNNIKKTWPYFNWYPSWIYFKIFDKEYFRTIDVKMT